MKPTKNKKYQLPDAIKRQIHETLARLDKEEQLKKLEAEKQRQRALYARENACDY